MPFVDEWQVDSDGEGCLEDAEDMLSDIEEEAKVAADDATIVPATTPNKRKAPATNSSSMKSAVKKPRTRTLCRLKSCPTSSKPQVSNFLCVTGQPLKTPIPVWPLKRDASGRNFVLLNEHLPWLRRACASKGSMHYEESFQSAVSALRRELQKKLGEVRSSETASGRQSKVRQGLEVGDSDDEGDKEQQASKSQAKKCSGTIDATKTIEVKLHGEAIQMVNCPRPLAVEATPATLEAVIAFCKEHIQTGEIVLKKHKKAEAETASQTAAASTPEPRPGFQMPTTKCVPILGKVTWHPSANAWASHWKNSAKQMQVTRFHVRVPKPESSILLKFGGGGSTGKGFHDLRQEKYLEAVKYWNEQDCSNRDRIPLPAEGLGDSVPQKP